MVCVTSSHEYSSYETASNIPHDEIMKDSGKTYRVPSQIGTSPIDSLRRGDQDLG